MLRMVRVAIVIVGALGTAVFALFAATFGDCGPEVTLAACEQGKDDALRVALPIALLLYAAAVAAVWRWPRILRWPRR